MPMYFLKRSNMAIHSFTCKQAIRLYSPATEHNRSLAATHFTIPRRVEGSVDLDGWLYTEIKCHPWESNPDTVIHPSTNRARRRLTSLIETNALYVKPTSVLLSFAAACMCLLIS